MINEEKTDKFAIEVEKGLKSFSHHLSKMGVVMNYKIGDVTTDQGGVDFNVNGIGFLLTWRIGKRQTIGGEVDVVEYVLSIWKFSPSTYNDAEDVYDEELISSQSWYVCLKEAFLEVERMEINNAFECCYEPDSIIEEM